METLDIKTTILNIDLFMEDSIKFICLEHYEQIICTRKLLKKFQSDFLHIRHCKKCEHRIIMNREECRFHYCGCKCHEVPGAISKSLYDTFKIIKLYGRFFTPLGKNKK